MRSLRTLRPLRWLLLACPLLCPAVVTAQGGARTPIEIVLQPLARVDGPVIRLGHVAQLRGGDFEQRTNLALLDVAEFRNGEDLVLSRTDVKFRLLLAETARAVRFGGAMTCRVKRAKGALTEAAVIRAARQHVQEHLTAMAQRLTVTPTGLVLLPVLDIDPGARVVLRPQLTDTGVALGETPVDVFVVVNGQARGSVRAWFEVRPATTATVVRSGTTSPDDPTFDDLPVVVRARDRVKMLAHVGSTQLIATGEALEDGRVGQSIRVRNVDSRKEVQGRVIGPGLVEVAY